MDVLIRVQNCTQDMIDEDCFFFLIRSSINWN